MATSVSRINVTVGANATQLNSTMQQAAASVQGFSGSAGNAQFAVQQLVFAADDAVASFGTGGFQGAIRGAQNNVTAFAASIFGVKGLMIAVAGFAAVQLVNSLLKVGKTAEKVKDQFEGLAAARTALLERREGVLAARNDVFDEGRGQTPGQAADKLRKFYRERLDVEEKVARLQRDRDKTANRFIPGALEGNEAAAAKFRKLRDEELEGIDKLIKSESERLEILKAQEETQRNVLKNVRKAFLEGIAPDVPGSRFGFGANLSALGDLARNAKPLASQLDPFRFFGSLPGANAFGSSGAVSAINQAQIGPRNVENAQLRELQEIKRSSADISRALGGKLPIAVEVPL